MQLLHSSYLNPIAIQLSQIFHCYCQRSIWLTRTLTDGRCCGKRNKRGSGRPCLSSSSLALPLGLLQCSCRARELPCSCRAPRHPWMCQLMSWATLCIALNKYTVTSTAISFIPHWHLCLVLSCLEENIPPLYFLVPVLFLSLYKAAPSSDPYFPPSISLLTALLTVTAWKAQKERKGSTKLDQGQWKVNLLQTPTAWVQGMKRIVIFKEYWEAGLVLEKHAGDLALLKTGGSKGKKSSVPLFLV